MKGWKFDWTSGVIGFVAGALLLGLAGRLAGLS